MKALVTGGAGFIGSHIQDRLIEQGHEVAILDNLRSGKQENLNPQAKFFKADITDKATVEKVFQEFKPEIVFHLAAQNEVPFSMKHHFEDEQMNIVGTMNILEAMVKNGTKKIVYSNTGGALYGEVTEDKLPIKEDERPLRPTSFYGVSKLCAEMYIRLYGNLNNLQWVSLRYSNVYGPRQMGNKEAGIVAIFTEKMLKGQTPTINGDGKNTRDYIYVGDVVEANVKALDYPENDFFNISTGVETSNDRVFATITQVLSSKLQSHYGPARPGDAFRVSLDPKKATEKLNWAAKVDFQTGVQKTIEYYKNTP